VTTDPTPKPGIDPKPPEPRTRDAISASEAEDDELVARAAETRGHDTRSHVVTEEPSLVAAEATPQESKRAPDESNGDDDDGEGDADDDESTPPSADDGSSSEAAAGAADEGGEAGDGDKRPKSRRARKTARLQKDLAEARDRITELERSAQASPPAEPAKEPISDDFASWDEYAEAKAVFLAEKKVAEQSPNQGGAGTGTPIPASWGEVSDKYSDFDAIAYEKSLAVNQTMVDQLIDMDEEGAEALYYLGKHPDEAKRIATVKGETAVARELAKIAVKAIAASKATGNGSQPPASEAANVAPTVSNAPPPIGATEGGGAQGRQVDLDNASPEEYRSIRRKQMAARG
jgi:hypothetical protein